MKKEEDLGKVIDNSLCIACGACLAVDPTLSLHLNSNTMLFEPSGKGDSLAAGVCPSIDVDYSDLQSRIFGHIEVKPLGVIDSLALAQSANRTRNFNASSGGLIRELLSYLLAQKDVDGAIVLSHSGGLNFEPDLIRDNKNIDELPGSIYHMVSFAKTFQILSNNCGRFVVVATPCQLEGIYNFIFQHKPELKDRIHTTIGLMCGWTFNFHSLRAISAYKGLRFDKIENVSYRGQGKTGDLVITTPDKTARINRKLDLDYMVAFDRSFNSPRCHICVNHVNLLADIVVGDAWLESTKDSKAGVSLLICRTPSLSDIIRTLHERKLIHLTKAEEANIHESQSRNLVFGDFAYSYAQYLKNIGEYCPNLHGPNYYEATKVPDKEIERFHKELQIKLNMQGTKKYRRMWWRKLILELALNKRIWKKVLHWILGKCRNNQLTGDCNEEWR